MSNNLTYFKYPIEKKCVMLDNKLSEFLISKIVIPEGSS